MPTTYDVRIWKIDVYKGKTTTAYTVMWRVGAKRWKKRFRTSALADSYRADLISASRRGEAFDTETGLPVSAARPAQVVNWLDFACDYMDTKWPGAAATYRRSISEALTAITPAMLDGIQEGAPDGVAMRRALHRWAFNTARRDASPAAVRSDLRWLKQHAMPVGRLAERAVLRGVLDTLAQRLDGRPAAASVVSKRRRVLFNVLEYAVERELLATNPLPTFKWTAPKVSSGVDRRTVVNPVQARTLLAAVGEAQRSGPQLVAFFALLYFAALRPEEAANVRKHNLSLPSSGWGEVYIDEATPYAGADWTDDGAQRDVRQLKNRARGEGRTVPTPPELTGYLNHHLASRPIGPDGRLFPGERVPELPKLTYMRTWRAARRRAFTPDVVDGPLGATPYTLRHACVSTWLNGGVPATQVAEWAGHSVEVLLKVYAKCLDGQDAVARRRVEDALGGR
ncbi:tyrosine-type recombinase/integrase [Pseudonocardia sp. EV170527-09]|uniref:tyrosine-type recombinase/integrase n=1 Tax=Pseudonocardia sp. EV170527-09 TaxID=2603411 RepID=UPI0011F35190|nr:tyrosine-type recombinase/integrase [Pseudonocardia sp. EV170527-09]KAA1022364.1 tyrosine-type recombinase/integrase [Pseudonocardia sp. EV170527-09]